MSPNLLLPPLAALYSIVSIASITHDGSESYIMAKGVIAKVQKSKRKICCVSRQEDVYQNRTVFFQK